MTSVALRLAVALVTASLALGTAIPVYPGATVDAAGMKIDRANDPSHTSKLYLTADAFEKVYTFYQNQKGATEETAVAKGNSAAMKNAVFQFKGGAVAITWPSTVLGATGQVITSTGTRISVDAGTG